MGTALVNGTICFVALKRDCVNALSLTALIKMYFLPRLASFPKCFVVLYEITVLFYWYFCHNIQTNFVRVCPFYEISCGATIKKLQFWSFYFEFHWNIGSCIIHRFAKEPLKATSRFITLSHIFKKITFEWLPCSFHFWMSCGMTSKRQ